MELNDFSNKTLYGIKSDTARHFWIGYSMFVLFSSFVGDTTILIASIRYNAFKLHKLIVVIIQHIAVCDLIVSCVSVLPRVVSLMADGWVLGTPLCYILFSMTYYSATVAIILICCMTACKLLILNYPFRLQTLSEKHAHAGCAVIWVSVVSLPVIIILADPNDVKFTYKSYGCDFGYSAPVWSWLRPVLATIYLFVPSIFVVVSTVCLLVLAYKVAHKSHESLKWQGVTTTILVALAYCMSTLPYCIYHFTESSIEDQSSFFHNEFTRISYFCLLLNTISNFYIYCLTVPSFRKFLWLQIQKQLPFRRKSGGDDLNMPGTQVSMLVTMP